jgi:hypothetical protein
MTHRGRATSLSVGPLTFTRFSPPPRAGFGVLLLTFTVWVVIELLRLCWWTAKVTVVATMVAVAVVVNWSTGDADSKLVSHDDDVRARHRRLGQDVVASDGTFDPSCFAPRCETLASHGLTSRRPSWRSARRRNSDPDVVW